MDAKMDDRTRHNRSPFAARSGLLARPLTRFDAHPKVTYNHRDHGYTENMGT
jgi:hypothetical protein